jgi:hypothetical protein
MRFPLIALGLLAVACSSGATRDSGQLAEPAAIATSKATPASTVAPTAPAPTPVVTAPPARTVAPVQVAAFDPLRFIGQGDRFNCGDFASQAQAQTVLRADPRDPNRLDGNDNDGLAFESNSGPFDRVPVIR